MSTPVPTSGDADSSGYQIRRNAPAEEGAVVVPRALASTTFAALVLYLRDRAQAGGGVLTPDARALLRDLHRAAGGTETDAVIEPSSDKGTMSHSAATVATTGAEVSVSEAAALLGCTPEYVRRLARTGALTARRIGARPWAINRASLDTYRHGGIAV
ncbi:helix-turn-helix domain-containing protein [Streptomyces sp. NPDC002599]|uniref:helix-turn-helix domain-containing protein n=1 Tax=Streptomyces sp. NPDC002599 TaxID=3154421 RepID=UPI00331D79F2